MIILAIIFSIVLNRTPFGRWLYATGSNERAAQLSGVPVRSVKTQIYVLSGLCAGIVGILQMANISSATADLGTFYELNAIAAVVIGGAALSGGRGTVRGTIIGAFVIGFLANGLVIVGVSPFWQKVITGAVIILAVAVDQIQQIVQRRRSAAKAVASARAAAASRGKNPEPVLDKRKRLPYAQSTRRFQPIEREIDVQSNRITIAAGRRGPDQSGRLRRRRQWRWRRGRALRFGGGGGTAGGPIAVITVDPSNPYWKAQIDTASAEFKKLGYQPTTSAHENDPDTQNQLIETAINDKVKGVLLDPAGADESVAAVQKLVDAKIPVVLINAEISQTGLAKAQIVSNNAQGATVGAEEWAKAMNYKGTYVELLGKPSDNNAQVRSDGYKGVISQYPDLKQVGKEIANWDRQEGQEKMESLLSKNPDVQGVIAGNDEMALGASMP